MASVAGEGEEVNQVAIIGGAVLAEIGEFRGAHAGRKPTTLERKEMDEWMDCRFDGRRDWRWSEK